MFLNQKKYNSQKLSQKFNSIFPYFKMNILINIVDRGQGRKSLTEISGIDNIDYIGLTKYLKAKYGTNGTVIKDNGHPVIQIQGDRRADILVRIENWRLLAR